MLEIERKFLVEGESFKREAFEKLYIKQGYLNSHPARTVRVRIQEDKGFLTVKGRSNDSGTTRTEWEKEIEPGEASELLTLCEAGVIEKTRYKVKKVNHIFEVDVFAGENEGLVVAEVELNSEKESFPKPEWLGKEVTGDTKYYNSYLSKNPYRYWNK